VAAGGGGFVLFFVMQTTAHQRLARVEFGVVLVGELSPSGGAVHHKIQQDPCGARKGW
jgi:hypothetical protein